MALASEIDDLKERLKEIRLRLARPNRLKLQDVTGLKAEARVIENLIKDADRS